VDPMSKRAEKISCSEGSEQRESFSPGVIQLSRRDKRSSSIIGTEEVNTVLKWGVNKENHFHLE
jgi:hypothetical protein